MSNNTSTGSYFDDFLREEGTLEETELVAKRNLFLQEYSNFANSIFGSLPEGVLLEDFLYIALVGEHGEVADQYKKFMRGDYHHKDNNKMILELGDCFYYFCMLCEESFVSLVSSASNLDKRNLSFFEITSDMCACLSKSKLDSIDLYWIGVNLLDYLNLLGYSLEDVLNANRNKLIQRYK